jgi:hypothetical protein
MTLQAIVYTVAFDMDFDVTVMINNIPTNVVRQSTTRDQENQASNQQIHPLNFPLTELDNIADQVSPDPTTSQSKRTADGTLKLTLVRPSNIKLSFQMPRFESDLLDYVIKTDNVDLLNLMPVSLAKVQLRLIVGSLDAKPENVMVKLSSEGEIEISPSDYDLGAFILHKVGGTHKLLSPKDLLQLEETSEANLFFYQLANDNYFEGGILNHTLPQGMDGMQLHDEWMGKIHSSIRPYVAPKRPWISKPKILDDELLQTLTGSTYDNAMKKDMACKVALTILQADMIQTLNSCIVIFGNLDTAINEFYSSLLEATHLEQYVQALEAIAAEPKTLSIYKASDSDAAAGSSE